MSVIGKAVWTEEMDAMLRSLYVERKWSYKECAIKMGVTRNSAIGRGRRIGLDKERPVVRLPPKPKKPRQPPPKPGGSKIRPPAPVLLKGEDIPPTVASILDLKRTDCAYPYGKTNFQFCGRPKERGAFCEAHARLCYNESVYKRNQTC